MKSSLLLALAVLLALPFIPKAQDVENEKPSVIVPDNVLREVVRRILVYNFKPPKRPKVIYLAHAGVSRSWLPVIPNIEFRLLSDEEIEDDFEKVYFFTKPELSTGSYSIGFAYGDPSCDYSGDTWSFRDANNRVRLWLSGGFGAGCGGSDGEFKTPGQLNSYPNEINGFRFFDRGRLEGLRLAVSTRADVAKMFGSDCKQSCEYDPNWSIHFTYFNDFHRERTVDEKRIKIVAKEEYNDKLYSISLRPKNKILFDKVVFPRSFRKERVYTAAHDGMGGGTNSTHDIYFDRYGLKYSVLDKVSLTTVKDLKWHSGELTSIEYTIPEKLEETMFIEEK